MTTETSEQKIPAHELYQQIYKDLKINPRTIQWYATEGYIPKPEKIGAEAFYAASVQIPARIRVIQTLQKRFDLKLKEIKQITEKQSKSDWEVIYNMLTALEEHFPISDVDYNGNEYVTEKGSGMARIISEKLKTLSIDDISLAEAEEEYDKAQEPGPSSFDAGEEIPF